MIELEAEESEDAVESRLQTTLSGIISLY